MMNYEWRKAIEAMQRDGYAVVVFTPEEVAGLIPEEVVEAIRDGFLIGRERYAKKKEQNDDN